MKCIKKTKQGKRCSRDAKYICYCKQHAPQLLIWLIIIFPAIFFLKEIVESKELIESFTKSKKIEIKVSLGNDQDSLSYITGDTISRFNYEEGILLSHMFKHKPNLISNYLEQHSTKYSITEKKKSIIIRNDTPLLKNSKESKTVPFIDELGYNFYSPINSGLPQLDLKLVNNSQETFWINKIYLEANESKSSNNPVVHLSWQPSQNFYQEIMTSYQPIWKGGSTLIPNKITFTNDSSVKIDTMFMEYNIALDKKGVDYTNLPYTFIETDIGFENISHDFRLALYENEVRFDEVNNYFDRVDLNLHNGSDTLYYYFKLLSQCYSDNIFDWYQEITHSNCSFSTEKFLQGMTEGDFSFDNIPSGTALEDYKLKDTPTYEECEKIFDLVVSNIYPKYKRTNPNNFTFFIYGHLQYWYNDKVSEKLSFEKELPLIDIFGRGALGPDGKDYYVKLESDSIEYKVIIDDDVNRYLEPNQIERFKIKLGAKKTSNHKFKIVLEDINGKQVKTKSIDLDIFMSKQYFHQVLE